MVDQPLAHRAPRTDDDVQHALGDSRRESEALELERRERREAGGLQDDGVAGGQRGTKLPRGDRDREVPGDDQRDHPERLAERHVDAAGDRDGAAEEALGGAGVVVEDVDDHDDLAARIADRLADVARLESRQLVRVVGHGRGEAAQELCPVARCHGAPRRKRRLGPGDGTVGILDARFGHLGEHPFGGRFDDLHGRNFSAAQNSHRNPSSF